MGAAANFQAFHSDTCFGPYPRPSESIFPQRSVTACFSTVIQFNTDLAAGNLPQIFDPNGWPWHQYIKDTYGGAVKIHGLYGVSSEHDYFNIVLVAYTYSRIVNSMFPIQKRCTVLLSRIRSTTRRLRCLLRMWNMPRDFSLFDSSGVL